MRKGIKKGFCRIHGELTPEISMISKEKYGERIRCKLCKREYGKISNYNRSHGKIIDRRFNDIPSICEMHGREKNKENYYTCDICANERHRRKYKKNIQEERTKSILQNLKHTNLTREMYDLMFEEQKGLCKICNQPETRISRQGEATRLAVDHCHRTLKIRALLCHDCNTGLGKFSDNADLLRNAITYLELHG